MLSTATMFCSPTDEMTRCLPGAVCLATFGVILSALTVWAPDWRPAQPISGHPPISQMPFAGLRCPLTPTLTPDTIPGDESPSAIHAKYNQRARQRCRGSGLWNRPKPRDHKLMLSVIATTAKLRRESLIFDWGSGCGHALGWLAARYATWGVGIDLSRVAVQYAIKYHARATEHVFEDGNPVASPVGETRNRYCHGDASDLAFLPGGTFDHAFSFGSVSHLRNRTLICSVLRQLVRIVRPADATTLPGTVFVGWMADSEYRRKDVKPCLRGMPVEISILEEARLFRAVTNFPRKGSRKEINTFSILLSKTASHSPTESDSIPVECDTLSCRERK